MIESHYPISGKGLMFLVKGIRPIWIHGGVSDHCFITILPSSLSITFTV